MIGPDISALTEGAAVACLQAATFAHPEAMCIFFQCTTLSKTDIHAQHEILIFLYFKETENPNYGIHCRHHDRK